MNKCCPPITAVVFDLFGTLVKIGNKSRPFRKALQYLEQLGRCPEPDDGTLIMSTNVGIVGAVALLGCNLPQSMIVELELMMLEELSSVGLMADVALTLQELRTRGLKVGICSNLAAPYALPVKLLLQFFKFDSYAWSFAVGHVKPHPPIYEFVRADLGVPFEEILFVGDTPEHDVYGPTRVGMQALLIDYNGKVGHKMEVVYHLPDVITYIDKYNHK